jgi:hypothetical protein
MEQSGTVSTIDIETGEIEGTLSLCSVLESIGLSINDQAVSVHVKWFALDKPDVTASISEAALSVFPSLYGNAEEDASMIVCYYKGYLFLLYLDGPYIQLAGLYAIPDFKEGVCTDKSSVKFITDSEMRSIDFKYNHELVREFAQCNRILETYIDQSLQTIREDYKNQLKFYSKEYLDKLLKNDVNLQEMLKMIAMHTDKKQQIADMINVSKWNTSLEKGTENVLKCIHEIKKGIMRLFMIASKSAVISSDKNLLQLIEEFLFSFDDFTVALAKERQLFKEFRDFMASEKDFQGDTVKLISFVKSWYMHLESSFEYFENSLVNGYVKPFKTRFKEIQNQLKEIQYQSLIRSLKWTYSDRREFSVPSEKYALIRRDDEIIPVHIDSGNRLILNSKTTLNVTLDGHHDFSPEVQQLKAFDNSSLFMILKCSNNHYLCYANLESFLDEPCTEEDTLVLNNATLIGHSSKAKIVFDISPSRKLAVVGKKRTFSVYDIDLDSINNSDD